MPNSISYEGDFGKINEWTIPSLDKWISGEAFPAEGRNAVTAQIVVPIPSSRARRSAAISVNVFNSGAPRQFAEEFVDLDMEFRVLLMDILTKFLNQDLITQLVDTTHMDFIKYHGSWSASWIKDTLWKSSIPHNLLNTSGLYILLPNDPQKVKIDGLRVMYRQAQRYNMEHYDAIDKQVGLINLSKKNEILTIIFPPIAKTPEIGDIIDEEGWSDFSYDSEPISQTWLHEEIAGHSVLMVLGVKSETPACLNWNLNQLTQLLSKITLSSRAS